MTVSFRKLSKYFKSSSAARRSLFLLEIYCWLADSLVPRSGNVGIEREKKALGYSVQEVAGDDLVEAREIHVGNSLKGKVAGVFV